MLSDNVDLYFSNILMILRFKYLNLNVDLLYVSKIKKKKPFSRIIVEIANVFNQK